MKASSTLFLCSHCDAQFSKWSGRCLECGAWGTVAEGDVRSPKQSAVRGKPSTSVPLASIDAVDVARLSSGLSEIDTVLGGGIVPGSLILLGGEPGIGKSTILAQIALSLAAQQKPVLYCSGEESGRQVKMRLDRLSTSPSEHLRFLGETNIDTICATIANEKPTLAIIDSIQTMATDDVPSEAGAVAQVRACTVKCLEVAKTHGVPLIITGHVTKEGTVAGPKTLEHLVDTVLYLEGDSQQYFRLLKTAKNRFGSTNEIGIFEMTGAGLAQVDNPSAVFLGENQHHAAGTVAAAIVEGSRAFLVHVQALVSKTYFGYPQRRAAGFDTNRLQLLVAVLSKRLGVNLGDQDIHINIVGGMKVSEPALDLAIVESILSAYKNKPLDPATIVFGEVGLSGEVRSVPQAEKRLKEAAKLGFTSAIMPKQKEEITGLAIRKIKSLAELEL